MFHRSMKVGSIGIVAALGLVCGDAFADVVNGDFSSPTVAAGTFTNFTNGSAIGTGAWTARGVGVSVVSGSFQQNGIAFVSPTGTAGQWLDLTGFNANNSTDGVTQSIATVAGGSYQLTFSVGSVFNPGGIFGTSSTVNLQINGAADGAFTNSCTTCTTTQGWQQFTVDFTATGPSTSLGFFNGDPATDNDNGLGSIHVVQVGTLATPEPAAYALLAAGLGILGVLARRRKA